MTENHGIPATTLKIIDAMPGFSISFCKFAFFRKISSPILGPATLLHLLHLLHGFPIAARAYPTHFPRHVPNSALTRKPTFRK